MTSLTDANLLFLNATVSGHKVRGLRFWGDGIRGEYGQDHPAGDGRMMGVTRTKWRTSGKHPTNPRLDLDLTPLTQ